MRSQSHSMQLLTVYAVYHVPLPLCGRSLTASNYSPSTVYHHNYSVAVSQQTIIRRLRRLLSTITIIRSQFLSSQQSTVRRLQSTITIIRSMFSSQQSTVRSLTTINRKPSTVYPYNKSVAVSQPSTGRCHVLKIDLSRRPSSLIVFVFVLQ